MYRLSATPRWLITTITYTSARNKPRMPNCSDKGTLSLAAQMAGLSQHTANDSVGSIAPDFSMAMPAHTRSKERQQRTMNTQVQEERSVHHFVRKLECPRCFTQFGTVNCASLYKAGDDQFIEDVTRNPQCERLTCFYSGSGRSGGETFLPSHQSLFMANLSHQDVCQEGMIKRMQVENGSVAAKLKVT